MASSAPKHLILICCHAIFMPGPANGLSENEWLLAPFQHGETPTFIEHIKTGLRLLANDPESLIVFSGSKTRPETELSEAQSYLNLCEENDFWGILDGFQLDEKKNRAKNRILLEEQALDSFGNLLFSVINFWRKTGNWPGKITVVSHEFKRARFEELHVKALRWSRGKFEFVGVDPGYMLEESPESDTSRTSEVREGERERGFGAWEKDLYGAGDELRGKRWKRNCWLVGQDLFVSEEERKKSAVRTKWVECEEGGMRFLEEVLLDEEQPWEAQ